MSLAKYQSVTSDTRLTASLHASLPGQLKFAKQLIQSEQCQVQFLRRKNGQLQERVTRMAAKIEELQNNKIELLALNQKYVKVVNEYYRRAASSNKENKTANSNNLLFELEKDHRNLVKHCLGMQEEIKNYVNQMKKFNEWKKELFEVNHTQPRDLIEELRCLTDENRLLKKENNKLEFDLQKSREECVRLKKGKEQWQDKADEESGELERYKSLVNTIQQESTDKSNAYEAKIYQLQIKVQKLQKELRREQQNLTRTQELRRRLQMAQVEHVHERDKLRMSVREKKNRSRGLHSASFYQ